MKKICCICGAEFEEFGNNPEPIREEGECCSWCNMNLVVKLRQKIAENIKEARKEN